MAEYIDRDDLAKWLKDESDSYSMKDIAPIGWTLIGLINELSKIPTADVVEVVRCKDCRMANSCSDDRDMYCTLNHCYKGKNYFCADGKKREEHDG